MQHQWLINFEDPKMNYKSTITIHCKEIKELKHGGLIIDGTIFILINTKITSIIKNNLILSGNATENF